jgi:hypothetical protein
VLASPSRGVVREDLDVSHDFFRTLFWKEVSAVSDQAALDILDHHLDHRQHAVTQPFHPSQGHDRYRDLVASQ